MSKALKSLLIVSGTTLCISMLLYISLYLYTERNLKKVLETVTQIRENTNRSLQAQKLKVAINNSKELQAQLKTYFIPDKDVVKSVESIEALARKSNVEVTISSLAADDSTNLPVGTINKIQARVDAKGNWKDIISFMTLIEAFPYKSSINNISFRASEEVDKKKSPIWNLSFKIEILKIK